MASDVNPALRTQLTKDRDDLAPQIRGLPDVATTSISADLKAAMKHQLDMRVHRRDLLQKALDDLDVVMVSLNALEDDGWPAPVGPDTLSPSLFHELQGEQSDLESAIAVFRQQANITIDPTPSFTSQPAPTDKPGP